MRIEVVDKNKKETLKASETPNVILSSILVSSTADGGHRIGSFNPLSAIGHYTVHGNWTFL